MKEQQGKNRSSVEEARTQGGTAPQTGGGTAAGQPGERAAGTARDPSGANVHAYISRQLRAVYDDVAKQPVPDRFLELMKQLDTKAIER